MLCGCWNDIVWIWDNVVWMLGQCCVDVGSMLSVDVGTVLCEYWEDVQS